MVSDVFMGSGILGRWMDIRKMGGYICLGIYYLNIYIFFGVKGLFIWGFFERDWGGLDCCARYGGILSSLD